MFHESSLSPAHFLGRLFSFLNTDGIDPDRFEIDHVCYRTDDPDRYAALRAWWLEQSEWSSENMISGRPIAVFRLREPFIFGAHSIPLLELTAPGGNASSYPEGYEHAEFVLGRSVSDFLADHSHLPFDTKNLTKPVNPDVRLRYESISAKFHEYNLEYVIRHLDPKA